MVPKSRVTIFGRLIELTPLGALIITTLLLRIPSLFEPYWYGDEGIYLTLGEGIRQGLTLYRDIHDNKPPLLYLLAALSGSLFWFRLLLMFWHTITVWLFWQLAEKVFGQKERPVFFATGIFTLLTSLPLLEGNIANAEIFMIGPIIGAMLLLFSSRGTYKIIFISGLLFSFAALFKIPAALDMAAVFAFWLIINVGGLKKLYAATLKMLVLAAGFLTPILATFAYYWTQQALPQYLKAAWSQNLGYLSSWAIPQLGGGEVGLKTGLLFRTEILILVLLVLLVFRKRFSKPLLFVSVWLALSSFAALLSGRPYPHYLISTLPALSLATAFVVFGLKKQRFLPLPIIIILLTSLVFYKFYYYPTFSYWANFVSFATGQKSQDEYRQDFDPRVERTYKLAKMLTNRTLKKDRVFIWGTEPEIYALSRRLPPGRYTTSYHIGDFSGEEETLEALVKQRPKYIIQIQDEKRQFPGLNEFVSQNYLYLETVIGADVYRLLSPQIKNSLINL